MDEPMLLYEISQGNELALKTMFNRHRNKLYNYLLGITKSKEIAEEIVIDVFLKLWQGPDLVVEIKFEMIKNNPALYRRTTAGMVS